MFDEEPSSQPSVPAEISPGVEPPDPFEGGEHPASGPDLSPETSAYGGPSALEAGKILPVAPAATGGTPTTMGLDEHSEDLKEPAALKRILLATFIIVVLGGVGAGVWWYLNNNDSAPVSAAPAAPAKTEPADSVNIDSSGPAAPPDAPAQEAEKFKPDSSPDVGPTPAPAPATPAAPAQPAAAVDVNLDSDKDGLTDVEETKLATDVKNPDSDADGLSDGAEAHIWFTDPLKTDTDGDTFSDGVEVMNGFNPRGAGKLH